MEPGRLQLPVVGYSDSGHDVAAPRFSRWLCSSEQGKARDDRLPLLLARVVTRRGCPKFLLFHFWCVDIGLWPEHGSTRSAGLCSGPGNVSGCVSIALESFNWLAWEEGRTGPARSTENLARNAAGESMGFEVAASGLSQTP